MKSKYIFIPCYNKFSPDSIIYVVWAGASRRDKIKLSLMELYCNDVGLYFKKYSLNVGKSLHLLGDSLFPGRKFSSCYLRLVHVSISDIYEAVIDNDFSRWESNKSIKKGHSLLLSYLDSSFFNTTPHPAYNKTCILHNVKSCVKILGHEDFKVVMGFCLILGLFLFAGYLEGLARLYGCF